MANSSAPTRRLVAVWFDSLGSVGALLCAIHCAALPFVLALLPALGVGIFASTGFEKAFVVFATVLGISSLGLSYRRHGCYHAFAFLLPGLVAVASGVLIANLHESQVMHAITMTIGGTLIAVAHMVNLRLSHHHAHSLGCRNGHDCV